MASFHTPLDSDEELLETTTVTIGRGKVSAQYVDEDDCDSDSDDSSVCITDEVDWGLFKGSGQSWLDLVSFSPSYCQHVIALPDTPLEIKKLLVKHLRYD